MSEFKASMPSNIALIKYMGKSHVAENIPSNASLSFTLDHLRTTVTLTEIEKSQDVWDSSINLNEKEKLRFLKHLQFIREKYQQKQFFQIHSENNFPLGCGLASSASSFAALTACAIEAFGVPLSIEKKANLSRQGSGSSCRSFFSPFALWKEGKVEKIDLPYSDLVHFVIVVSREKKAVSSSAAHERVLTSLLFENRVRRAEGRLEDLMVSMQNHDWEKAYHICWQEFWDMHALFETCEKPFGYLLPESIEALSYLKNYWASHHDGPLVTMDAGPNIHLLFRPDQLKHKDVIQSHFKEKGYSL